MGCHIHNVIEGTPTKASTVITTTTDTAITTKEGKIMNEPEIEYYKNTSLMLYNKALCQMCEMFNRNVF